MDAELQNRGTARPRFAWWRRLRPAPWESSTRLPSVKPAASRDLKWAKKVHTQQKTWLQHHCKLCKPSPTKIERESLTGEGFGLPLYGTVLRWARGLRNGTEGVTEEEQRLFLQRRSDGLQKLQKAQKKWRRQYQRKRSLEKDRLAAEELERSMQLEREPPQVGLSTLAEEGSETEDSPSSSESMTSSESVEQARLPTLVLQRALLRRNSLQRTELADTTSAKDVISSDVNLVELFDAGEEETEEEKKNKQLASLNGDYMASRLMSRTEERPAEVGAKAETPDASLQKEQFVANVRVRSEEWRTEFPVEVLNQLTAAYESWRDEDGLRTTSVRSMNHVVRYLLGWPPTVLQHVLEEPPPERLCFQNLRDFLELVKHALEVAEMEEPEVLWSEWDLNLVRESFRKFSSTATHTMPVVNLFKAVEVLGFHELSMVSMDSDRQRWLARITKQILARKDHRTPVETSRRESWAPLPTVRSGLGAQITFRDFLRIASRALRDAERQQRRAEFLAECEVIQASNYSTLQVEDVRELHGSFSAMKVSIAGSKSNLDAMHDLLERITQRPVEDSDLAKLRSVLVVVDAKGREVQDSEAVSFETFLRWMKDIRNLGVEGFSVRSCELTMEELEKRRGFHIAILREQLAAFMAQ